MRLPVVPALLAVLAFAVCRVPAAGQEVSDPLAGALELYFAGEVRAAADEFERLAGDLRRAGAVSDAAGGFNNACLLQSNLGQLERARDNCRLAVELRRREENVFGEARALNNLALVFQRTGDLDSAERHFREALERNQGIGEAEGAVINRQNLAAVAWARGRYDAALAEFRRAERVARGVDEPWGRTQLRIALQNQGAVLASLGSDRQALALYLELLAAGEDLPVAERAPLEYNAAVVYSELGDPIEAIARLSSSERLYGELDDGFGEALAKAYRAWVLHDGVRNSEEALRVLEQALDLARDVGGVVEEEVALAYLAEVLIDLGRLEQAQEVVEEEIALGVRSDQAASRWATAAASARLARAQGRLAEAVDWIEQAVEAVEGTGRDVSAPVDRARFVRAQERVYSLAVELQAESASDNPDGFERALRTVVRAKARDLFSRLGLEARVDQLSLARLRARLGGATLIEMFDTGEVLWRFVLTRSGATVQRIEDRERLLRIAERVSRTLAEQQAPDDQDLVDLGQGVLVDLGPDALAGYLVIAPVGALSRVPWELLPVEATGEPLLEQAVLSYLPSAALLFDDERSTTSVRPPWLAVASQGPGETSTILDESLPDLPTLQFVEREMQLLEGLAPGGSELVGSDATVARVLAQLRQPGADIVHLAAHALVDERPGYGSRLLLEDGVLGADQLAQVDLDVGLAVLAACSTTLGSDPSGLVLQSLTGSWLAAGAQSVVATLWDVDDRSTLAFMEQFYAQLGRGLEPAAALAATKRRLRRDPAWRGDPSWSAYVLHGTAGTSARSGPSSYPAAIAFGGALCLLAAVAVVWRRRVTSRL